MTPTRWRLQRPKAGQIEIQLVVEERVAPHRGYMVSVATRAYAREVLPELRRVLEASLARPQPTATFSPAESEAE